MRVVRFDRPEAFLEAAGSFLEADEAVHNVPLSVAGACRDDPGRYAGPNYFATVEEEGRIVGVASRTHPYRLLFYAPPEVAAAVAEDLARAGHEPPGVHGPAPSADAFANAWCEPRGLQARRDKDLRAFLLDAVIPAPPTPGGMRPASEADLPLAESWYRAFEEEAMPGAPGNPPEEVARRNVRSGRLFLWEVGGRPVAQAAASGSTPNGVRVGSVYTPPAHRRRGYATALVGALSERLLAQGKRCCYLFTDLANPISNSIYPKVGYRPVGDYRDWDFTAGARPGAH